MSSSAQDIPSTAYKPNKPAPGLDPVTVIRTPASDSQSQQIPASNDSHKSSTLGKLFPEDEQRSKQAHLPAGLQLGDYVIESRIGAGGMGAVFKARDEKLDRPVALKILAPHQASDPASIKRFQNEARSAARLDHDNIARIYAIGATNELHYIAFEYVEGITIRELIRQRGVVDPHETINFMLQISIALKHTAAAGVVHRDIKPSNLIITPAGRAKLVDWGLARKERLDDQSLDLTVSGTTLGTFDYISPEQARDPRNVDVRSDIYSLGCTCYHMLTGSPPYAEGTVLQKLLDHQGKLAPDSRDKNPNVPKELSRIVRKMMASDPEDRYWSPQALTHDLLVLAAQTGLHPVHPDGLTWRSQQDQQTGKFSQTVIWWWLGAFATACLFAILGDAWLLKNQEVAYTTPHSTQPNEQDSKFLELFTPSVDQITNRSSDPTAVPLGENRKEPEAEGNLSFPGKNPAALNTGDLPPLLSDQFGMSDTPAMKQEWTFPELFADSGTNQPAPQPGSILVDIQPELNLNSSSMTPGTARPVEGNLTRTGIIDRQFRVLALNGELIQTVTDLDTALNVVPDGGVIEIFAESGQTRPLPLRQLRIVDKSVNLRASSNSRTILQFDGSNLGMDLPTPDFIHIQGGGLTLTNLDIQILIDQPISTPWSVFAVEEAGRLRCRQSTVTIESRFQTAASIVHMERASLQSVDAMNRDELGEEVIYRVQFDDCLLRGAADLLMVDHSEALSLETSRSLLVLDGALLRYQGDNNIRTTPAIADVRFAQSACLINDGFLRVDLGSTIPRQPVQFQVRTEDSIFMGRIGQPLNQFIAPLDQRLIQEYFTWEGDHNLFGGWQQYLTIRGTSATATGPLNIEFDSWSQSTGRVKENNPRLLQAMKPDELGAGRFDQWTALKFLEMLNPDHLTGDVPADLLEYGPDYGDLPIPPLMIDLR